MLGHSVQTMVTAEQVVTYWKNVMKRAGCGEENHNKRQRKNNRPVVPF